MAKKKIGTMIPCLYDAFLWVFSILVDLFFREVHPRSSWKVPPVGPVIFVCAPHANQFVDPLILMRTVKKESGRRIHFLIAEKSMKRRFIGAMAALAGSVPVGRAMDAQKSTKGKIYLPDPVNDPRLIRGVGTDFENKDFQPGGLIVLPPVDNLAANAEIQEIIGPEELRLKRPFKGGIPMQQLTGRNDMTKGGTFVNGAESKKGPAPDFEGINFKVAPKVDQGEVYDAVYEVLHRGGNVGIFPEGGSHDRTDLLPLKAGVAIMALGAVAENPDCNVKIIPVGMNYFHAHKFRSRAVVEFGNPLDIPTDLAEKFRSGQRRDAIAPMLELVKQALLSVTVTAPDYDTLMLIQAVRRLYNSKGKRLPLPTVVELNRRLIHGYTVYKDDERIVQLKHDVIAYNKRLLALNIRDHQVEYAKLSQWKVVFLLIYRLIKLCVLSIFVIPGFTLFAFVFFCGKLISIQKSREALAASSVKIQARDVMATWKLLVAMAVAPLTYAFWITAFTYWCHRNRIQGYVPEWVPLKLLVFVQVIVFPIITYAALRFGEVGMDIVKSLWPLIQMLLPSKNNELVKLRQRRVDLAVRVTEIINELGPDLFPDFDAIRIVSDPFHHPTPPVSPGGRRKSETYSYTTSPTDESPPESIGNELTGSSQIPRNESFKDLTNTDFFSTRPSTPKKTRSRNGSLGGFGGFALKPFSTLDGEDSFTVMSGKIRNAMVERKRRSSGASGWESGMSTPSEEADEDLTITAAKKDK